MKIHLDPTTIDPKRVRRFKRIGSRVCILQFITGESITVVCGVKPPDNNIISFLGTPEDLEELVARWHPDMRESPSMLNLQEKVRASNHITHQRLKALRKWRWTAIGFGIGFLGIGLFLIWSLLK